MINVFEAILLNFKTEKEKNLDDFFGDLICRLPMIEITPELEVWELYPVIKINFGNNPHNYTCLLAAVNHDKKSFLSATDFESPRSTEIKKVSVIDIVKYCKRNNSIITEDKLFKGEYCLGVYANSMRNEYGNKPVISKDRLEFENKFWLLTHKNSPK